MNDAKEELTDPEITRALKKLFKRCQTDMEFRKLCLTNPRAAIKEVGGKRLPQQVTIGFAEDATSANLLPSAYSARIGSSDR